MNKSDHAVARCVDALRQCPEWGIHRCDRLAELAMAHRERFELSGAIQDIERALTYQRQALGLCPVWNPRHITFAGNLAVMISLKFSRQGEMEDLEEAIQCKRKVCGLLPRAHPGRAASLHNLATSLYERFEWRGNTADIDEAVQLHREALTVLPAARPDRDSLLSDLGTSVLARFEQSGDAAGIDEAVHLHREVLALRPAPHADRASSLGNLGTSVLARFQQRGDGADIDEVVQLYREALALCPASHPDRATSLSNLGNSVQVRFQNLGNSVLARFQQRGVPVDIDEAVQLHREALALRPAPHPDRAASLSNLAISVLERFQHRGDAADIDEAVQLQREALALRPAPHPSRASSLNHLASTVHVRFEQRGDAADIDEPVQLHREALALLGAPHPERALALSNLALSVMERFEQRGDAADIDEAVQLHREALTLLLAHRRAGSLSNLGNALLERFQQRGDAADIDEAVQLRRDVLALRPAPHPDRASSLSALGGSVLARFQQRGDVADIDEAVQLQREALALCPVPHPGRVGFLSNLGNSVQARFEQRGSAADMDEAVQLHREALALRPTSHPDRASSLCNLGNTVMSRFRQRRDVADIDEAVQLHCEALALRPFPHSDRFGPVHSTTLQTACFSDFSIREMQPISTRPPSALDAYKAALGLLHRLVALDLDIRSRQEILVAAQTHNLGSEAVACAIDLGQYGTALELLEAGRSVFWSQSLHLRTSLDDLRISYPVLANKLAELSWRLEQSSFRDTSRNLHSDSHHRVMSLEAEGLNCRRLNDEWVTTVESIRSTIPGFEDFMQPKPMRTLRLAAQHGSVVVLNAGELSCHALVLDLLGNVQCVNLPAITRAFMNWMAEIIRALASSSPSALFTILDKRGDDLAAADRLLGRVVYEKDARPEDWFEVVLRILWIAVVKPVLSSLKIQKSDDPPRIWWCPTGPFTFLPIHAAGIYNESSIEESVMDYVISSYTPTLTALLSPPFPPFTSNKPLRSTVIIQPNTPGQRPLPSTKHELRKIEGQIPDDWLTTLGSGTASLNTILPQLQTSSIIHFACHGEQHAEKPLQSALLIGSERLTVAQIMRQSGISHDGGETTEKQMGLAFLSACETSMGDKKLPDEAMHLAATLLFSGFRSVVATMWTMHDPDGPEVAEAFYGHLFRNADAKSNPPVFPDLNGPSLPPDAERREPGIKLNVHLMGTKVNHERTAKAQALKDSFEWRGPESNGPPGVIRITLR
ncbi:CHAT domain-containing protein [Mycena vulgaris]|nr:CHAT domain-containing protein [Mycena vulgaris]